MWRGRLRTTRGLTEPAVHGALMHRMFAASTLLALLICGAFAVVLVATEQQRDTARLARHSQLVLSTANQLERLIVDLETGERGYLLTGEQQFLEPWRNARAAYPNVAARLVRLAQDPNQHQRALRIQRSGTSYIRDYSNPLVEAATQGDANASRPVVIEDGRRRVNAIRAEFEALDVAEQRLANARDDRSRAAAQRARASAVVGVAGSVILVALFTAYLYRAIVVPVRRASGLAGRLAGGDLAARMPETSIGEIGALEHAFNTMGESLERGRDDLARLAEEQAALRRVATFVARGVAPAEVFSVVAEEVGKLLDTDGTRVFRYESDNSVTIVAGWGEVGRHIPIGTRIPIDDTSLAASIQQTGAPSRLDDLSGPVGPLVSTMRDLGVTAMVGAPVIVEGRLWGLITALSKGPGPLPPDTESRFSDFTDLVATAIANTAARTELTASRRRAVEATDRTRRAIERDLHDGTQQRLVSLTLDLRSVEARVPADQPELRSDVAVAAAGLTDALEELRELSRGIHPAILTEGGLLPALKGLARRSAVPVELDAHTETRLPQRIEVAAYYIVAEALTNAAKHARANVISVRVAPHDGRLRLVIRDDGVGGADPIHGTGLIGLIDRVEALDGTIVVRSPPGRGTLLRVELPTVDD